MMISTAMDDVSWATIDSAATRFDQAWSIALCPELERFLPAQHGSLRRNVLVELVKIDQEHRWRIGDKKRVEAYLSEWPELRQERAAIIELLSGECLTGAVTGNPPSFKDLRTRFPDLCEQIPLAQILAEAELEGRKMSLLDEGQIIRGTYEVERLLGEGAFGEVYRVKHRFLGRQAMKVFKIVGMTIEETEEMLGEALLLSRIGHPNIIRVFDANTTDTSRGICGFFTMEYVAGGSLEHFWRSHGNRYVPVEKAVEIIRQVCRGLAVAHDESPPIVHRDVKPQNILVGYDGVGLRARLTDFGLAKHVNPLTMMATASGTRCFKPPEVFRDLRSDSCAGDVWALGVTLYLLLADRLPYPDLEGIGLPNDDYFRRPVTPPSRLNIRVDPLLDEIIQRALAVAMEDRYQNARELLDNLNRWIPPEQKPAVPVGKTTEPWQMSKSALGMHTPVDEAKAREMSSRAIALSRQASQLAEAADLMEEAFNHWPDLRQEHEYQVKLWRCGIIM